MSDLMANIPEAPTHALRMIDNRCGDSDLTFLFAFEREGVFYSFETGKPVLQYEGDKVLQAWPLTINAQQARTDFDGERYTAGLEYVASGSLDPDGREVETNAPYYFGHSAIKAFEAGAQWQAKRGIEPA